MDRERMSKKMEPRHRDHIENYVHVLTIGGSIEMGNRIELELKDTVTDAKTKQDSPCSPFAIIT